jgi:hypothetical protein
MRRDNNWYDDDEVLSFIRDLLIKYPPIIKKNIIIAFKEFIENFAKIELIWYEWENIYQAGKSPEEIINDILTRDLPCPLLIQWNYRERNQTEVRGEETGSIF